MNARLRRRAARPAVPLEWIGRTPTGPGRPGKSVAGAMAATRYAHLALVLALGAFALGITLAASSAVNGSPLAATSFGRHVMF